jgi:hypothetical protein
LVVGTAVELGEENPVGALLGADVGTEVGAVVGAAVGFCVGGVVSWHAWPA